MRPHLEYGTPACSPSLVADINNLERIQGLATRLVIGMHHLHYKERLQRLGLHSFQQRRLRADLITTFNMFTSPLDIAPNLFILLFVRSGLKGHPFKVLQGTSHRRRRGSTFSVRVVKYWNKLPASVVTTLSVKKRVGESLDRSLFPSSPFTAHSPPPPPHLPTTPAQ